jgi:hypothetical protein
MATTLWVDVTQLDPNGLGPGFWANTGDGAYFTCKDTSRGVTLGADTLQGWALVDVINTEVGTGVGGVEQASTVAGPTAGKTFPVGAFFTAPIDQDFTLSGSVQFNVCARESSMNANATVRMVLFRVDSQGALTQIIDSTLGTEVGTTTARHTWSGTPTSTAMKKGDRIMWAFMIDDATSVTMASGHTVTISHGGSAANLADTNVVLTETFGFLTTMPSGTSLWLRDTASDVSGEKQLSLTQGSGTVTAVHTTVAGPTTFPGDQWTATAGGSDISWMSNGLSAFTLTGVVQCVLGAADQSIEVLDSSPFDTVVIELARVDSDGTNPTIWARSYTSKNDSSTPTTRDRFLTGPDLAISQGQRLRLRIYQDDSYPFGPAASGTDRTIRYDGTSTYASRLIFTQTITEGVATPAPPYPLHPPHPMLHMIIR